MLELLISEPVKIRLDRFLRQKFTYFTQGIIEKNLRKGTIKVNKKNVKSNTRLYKGDIVIVAHYLIRNVSYPLQLNYFSFSIVSLAHKILNEYLIFSCDYFIIVNKPHGLATQGGSKIRISVDHALQYLNKAQKHYYRLVHRLDKNTSGVLIIAKTLSSSILLAEAFREKEIKKTYLAIVSGNTDSLSKTGVIESYINKDRSGIHEVVKETKDGKFAKTSYTILASDKTTTMIKYNPLTGRMHQLRYHSKQLGFPILGDMKYGDVPFKRMMLHASEIIIPAKIFGQKYMIEASLDNSFEVYIKKLKIFIST